MVLGISNYDLSLRAFSSSRRVFGRAISGAEDIQPGVSLFNDPHLGFMGTLGMIMRFGLGFWVEVDQAPLTWGH